MFNVTEFSSSYLVFQKFAKYLQEFQTNWSRHIQTKKDFGAIKKEARDKPSFFRYYSLLILIEIA